MYSMYNIIIACVLYWFHSFQVPQLANANGQLILKQPTLTIFSILLSPFPAHTNHMELDEVSISYYHQQTEQNARNTTGKVKVI